MLKFNPKGAHFQADSDYTAHRRYVKHYESAHRLLHKAISALSSHRMYSDRLLVFKANAASDAINHAQDVYFTKTKSLLIFHTELTKDTIVLHLHSHRVDLVNRRNVAILSSSSRP